MGHCLLAGLCVGLCSFLVFGSSSALPSRMSRSFVETSTLGDDGEMVGGYHGGVDSRPSLTLVLRMLAVAVQSGVSIPHALSAVGEIIPGRFGRALQRAAGGLLEGYAWQDVWIGALEDPSGANNQALGRGRRSIAHNPSNRDERDLSLLCNALEDSWIHGSSPVDMLESTVEQVASRQSREISQIASRLSVQVLMPTGLCFLPAFMLIGVIPAVASFMG